MDDFREVILTFHNWSFLNKLGGITWEIFRSAKWLHGCIFKLEMLSTAAKSKDMAKQSKVKRNKMAVPTWAYVIRRKGAAGDDSQSLMISQACLSGMQIQHFLHLNVPLKIWSSLFKCYYSHWIHVVSVSLTGKKGRDQSQMVSVWQCVAVYIVLLTFFIVRTWADCNLTR